MQKSNMIKKERRATHGGYPSTRAQQASRVEQLVSDTKKRRSQGESALRDRFQDAVNAYRLELASETTRQLDRTEDDLDKQLAAISAEFGGKLRIVAEYEGNIFKPISEERLEIIAGWPEKNGQSRKQLSTLAHRMKDFETIVTTEAAHLENLWKDWHATNLELVKLAIEVLGRDAAELALSREDNDLAAQMNAAAVASRRHEARRTALKEQAADLERSIRTTAGETINNLDEQEKEWKIQEKKKIQKIRQIVEGD